MVVKGFYFSTYKIMKEYVVYLRQSQIYLDVFGKISEEMRVKKEIKSKKRKKKVKRKTFITKPKILWKIIVDHKY